MRCFNEFSLGEFSDVGGALLALGGGLCGDCKHLTGGRAHLPHVLHVLIERAVMSTALLRAYIYIYVCVYMYIVLSYTAVITLPRSRIWN